MGAKPTSLHREVLTSSQEPGDPGGGGKKIYPSSVPVSFNTPRTSAWSKWTSCSQRLLLPRCLLSLSYLSPPTLTSSQRGTAGFFFLPPSFSVVFHDSILKCRFSHSEAPSGDYMAKNAPPDESPSLSCDPCKPKNSLLLFSLPSENAGAHSRVLLPPRDVRQQQRLPSGNEGGQEDGVRRGSAGVGQEARRPCQDQQDGTSRRRRSRQLYALYIWKLSECKHYLFIYHIVIPPLFLLAVH